MAKGAFFLESVIRFSNLQKKFQKTILNLQFKIPADNSIMLWAEILNFKFRIASWKKFLWTFKKRIALSEKKQPLEALLLTLTNFN